MIKAKRITANLPEDLLKEAQEVTGQGITETLVLGLRLVRRTKAFEKANSLKGKLKLDVNMEVSRERSRN